MNTIKKPYTKIKNWFSRLSFKKKLFVIIAIIIGIIAASNIISNITKKPDYTTAKITRSTINEQVTEAGQIEVSGRVDVYSPTNGTVENIFVKNGEEVTENDTLFTVKSSASEQEKASALATLLQAQSALGTANAAMYSLQSAKDAAWDTYYELATNSKYQNSDGSPKASERVLPEFTTTQNDWLAAEAQYKNQQAVVNQAKATLGSASLSYSATQNATVKSPADGTVSNLSVSPGKTVSAHSPTQQTQPVLTLANFINPEVVVQIGESDISKLKEGQKAEINISATNKKIYKGVVSRVDSVGTNNLGVIKYNVYVQILNPDDNLRSGMDADVTITSKTLANVLSAPNSAVKLYKGGRAVRVPGKNKKDVIYQPVKIGIRGESKTEILSGIHEGDTVIVSLSNEALKRQGLF
ncbi:MAG: efflux RND transporter periplasmic adaptor subunit [Candidatus Levybacteria bacterium]|nr:efflux RND transporter periplasmic adaptor subunit [Candidatus Levybacteria bacterium]MBP9814815.1 efflux RND transporter periplasmic adaptor subunit [Candidatus Levybacteria bacterium]